MHWQYWKALGLHWSLVFVLRVTVECVRLLTGVDAGVVGLSITRDAPIHRGSTGDLGTVRNACEGFKRQGYAM